VNPHNFCPVFTHEQIAASLQATILTTPTLCTATILDQNQLHSNILATLPSDSSISNHLSYLEGRWSKDNAGFLRFDGRMYVLDNANLWLRVLQYHHNYVLAGHLGQTRHWNSSRNIIPGQTSATMYKSSISLALPVYNPNHSITDHTDHSNNFLSRNIYGIQFLWTSLRNSYKGHTWWGTQSHCNIVEQAS